MIEENQQPNTLKHFRANNFIVVFLIFLLIGASFFIGVLYTKVQGYESG
ncbi:MAG: hypothetical protein ACD_24C00053G0002, partial [uncultured bacterium]